MAAPRGGQGTGFALAAAAAVLWGLSGVVAKTALRTALEPGALLVIRLAASAIIVGLWAALWRPGALRASRAAWPALGALGLAVVGLHAMYYATIQATTIGTAVFLQYLSPTLIVLVGWATLRQPRERWSALSVLTALAGSWLLVAAGGGLVLAPAALATGLGAAMALASQTILLDVAGRDASPVTVFFWSILVAAAVSIGAGDPAAIWRADWSLGVAAAAAYMVLGATVVPMFLMIAAVRRLGPAKAGVVTTLEPVVAAASAWLLLGESMTPVQWAGGALIIVAIGFVYLAPIPRVGTVDIHDP